MNSTNNRIQQPTETLFNKLVEAVTSYASRTPLNNGASVVTRLVNLIHSRRVLFLRNESHFRALWVEDISLDPALVDFFLTVGSDLKFTIELDGLAEVWTWSDVIHLLTKSLVVVNKDNAIINSEIRERLVDDFATTHGVLEGNSWVVTYILLQKLPLKRLTDALEPWRALANNPPAGDK